MEKPDGDGQGMPSMLDLTDEEKEIKITDDTVIVRGSMGGMSGGPQGNGGTPPDMQQIQRLRPNRIHPAAFMQPEAERSMHGILMLRQMVSPPQQSEVTAEAEKW